MRRVQAVCRQRFPGAPYLWQKNAQPASSFAACRTAESDDPRKGGPGEPRSNGKSASEASTQGKPRCGRKVGPGLGRAIPRLFFCAPGSPGEYSARNRREDFQRLRYATPESLKLDPLPCWQSLTSEQIRAQVSSLVAEIEAEAAAATGYAVSARGGPGSRSSQSSPAIEEVASASLPRLEPRSSRSALRGLQPLHRSLPGCRRKAAGRRSHGSLPCWQLPTASSLRPSPLSEMQAVSRSRPVLRAIGR
ncbi:MAG: hypothetical protein QOF89_3605 [Acidobacteriota bacterium]|jgi:hypothetical protein|nr:hypothetical protein [Acidobacteriota bacterium]